MSEYVTARFDTLGKAEAAATKLRAIRAEQVEISEWKGGDDAADDYIAYKSSFTPNMGHYYPFAGGLSTGTTGFMPYGAMGETLSDSGGYSQTYLVNAAVTGDDRAKALRIVQECGGNEV